jgi:GAF domain-containing protein
MTGEAVPEPFDRALVVAQARALFDGERDPVANAANLAALIAGAFPDLNWSGFYFVRGGELVLGPFAGKPACVRIARGAGVCGSAWDRAETIVVPDVHAFPGHIACDSASNAEIVVPLRAADGTILGVLDLDSPKHGRFDDADRATLEELAALYVASSDLA